MVNSSWADNLEAVNDIQQKETKLHMEEAFALVAIIRYFEANIATWEDKESSNMWIPVDYMNNRVLPAVQATASKVSANAGFGPCLAPMPVLIKAASEMFRKHDIPGKGWCYHIPPHSVLVKNVELLRKKAKKHEQSSS